jgi:antitoxin FitA
MATLTIRDLDDDLRVRLRVQAAKKGRSMEAEVREILREALTRPSGTDRFGSRIQQRFAAIGGVELDLPVRSELPRAAELP